MKNHDNQSQNSIPLSIIISNDNNSSSNNISSINNSLDNQDYSGSLLISKNNNDDEINDICNQDSDNNINNNNNLQDIDINNSHSKINITNSNKVPTFAYIILAIALFTMSSSGTVLKTINVPPLLKASWRLQSTSVLLFFGFIYEIMLIYDFHIKFIQIIPPNILNKLPQLIKDKINKINNFNQLDNNNNNSDQQLDELDMDINQQNNNNNNINNKNSDNSDSSFNKEEIKLKLFEKKTILLLLSTGFILALHFALWVSSLDETTLSHSLLFVTSSPLMVVIVMLIRRIPISKGEIIGCVLGFIGLIVTLFDSLFLNNTQSQDNSSTDSIGSSGETTSKGQNPTFYGDMLALLGAACIVFYLFAGSHLRKWMPIFCYAFIVTFTASIILSIASSILEDRQGHGLIGWFSSSFILTILYIAFGPGFLGHTGMNYVVKFLEPVVISVTLLLEPPIGTIMGYIVGVAGELPSLYTYLGGALILGGCGICTVSSHLKNKSK